MQPVTPNLNKLAQQNLTISIGDTLTQSRSMLQSSIYNFNKEQYSFKQFTDSPLIDIQQLQVSDCEVSHDVDTKQQVVQEPTIDLVNQAQMMIYLISLYFQIFFVSTFQYSIILEPNKQFCFRQNTKANSSLTVNYYTTEGGDLQVSSSLKFENDIKENRSLSFSGNYFINQTQEGNYIICLNNEENVNKTITFFINYKEMTKEKENSATLDTKLGKVEEQMQNIHDYQRQNQQVDKKLQSVMGNVKHSIQIWTVIKILVVALAAAWTQRCSYQDFDRTFEQLMRKYYKIDITKNQQEIQKDILIQFSKSKPSQKIYQTLRQRLNISQADLIKMQNGWINKHAIRFTPEFLDQILKDIDTNFNELFTNKFNKHQFCQLVVDQIFDQYKFKTDDKWLGYDLKFIEKFIYGKTADKLKNVDLAEQNEEKQEEEK